jgi:hypothetical protein
MVSKVSTGLFEIHFHQQFPGISGLFHYPLGIKPR